MPSPKLVPLVLSGSGRVSLEALSRKRKASQALAERARIVLACAEDGGVMPLTQVAARTGVSRESVRKWRVRFLAHRLGGLGDAPRPGAPRTITDKQIEALVTATLTRKGRGQDSHWSTRSMAAETGLSQSSVSRIWRAFGLKPHVVQTWKLSTDPEFISKVRDVAGLCMSPPEHALVLAVDEKSQIQALDRTAPCLPILPATPARMTHGYVRHGTTCPFAAYDLASGSVIAQHYRRHRHQEFLRFLKLIDTAAPKDLDLHLVLDNYATHKTPAIRDWLLKHPRFHLHFTPASSSWLNLVERWFAELTSRKLRRSARRSVPNSRPTSASGSTSGTSIPGHSPGPSPPTRSSRPSPPTANESLTQDTRGISKIHAVLGSSHHRRSADICYSFALLRDPAASYPSSALASCGHLCSHVMLTTGGLAKCTGGRVFRMFLASIAIAAGAASTLVAVSPLQSAVAASGTTVASGVVTTSTGVAAPDVAVTLKAWPSDAMLGAMKSGQTVPTVKLATATTNLSGDYVLQVPASSLAAVTQKNGYANLEIDSPLGIWFFTYQADPPAGQKSATVKVDLGNKNSGWACGYYWSGGSKDPYLFSGFTLERKRKPAYDVIGQGYIVRNGKTHGDYINLDYTHGKSRKQNSTLGVGLSGYGFNAGYKGDGTHTSTAVKGEDYGRAFRNTGFRTAFMVGQFRGVCYAPQGISVNKVKQHGKCPNTYGKQKLGVRKCFWLVSSIGWVGGQTTVHPKTAPSTPATYCLKHDGGDKFHTFNERAATWEHGFDLGGDLGIKGVKLSADFDSSTLTGYDANAELWFHFVKKTYLCGTNGYEAKAAILVARATKSC